MFILIDTSAINAKEVLMIERTGEIIAVTFKNGTREIFSFAASCDAENAFDKATKALGSEHRYM